MDSRRRWIVMEYMRLQWQDIHHSRNQDWKALLIILGVFSALFHLNGKDFQSRDTFLVQLLISVAGLCAGVIGIRVALAHWWLLRTKLKVIRDCEGAAGIRAQFPPTRIHVQEMILFTHVLVAGVLAGWVLWLLSQRAVVSRWPAAWCSIAVAGVIITGGWFWCRKQGEDMRRNLEQWKEMISFDE